jgi:hypothetical protein
VSAGEIIAIGLTAGTLVVALLAYSAQRSKKRIEYLVTANTELLPRQLPEQVQVTLNGNAIADPALAIMRICNTGTIDVIPEDFETHLKIELRGVEESVAASCAASRPTDLQPKLRFDGASVHIEPMLINTGDLMELHFLTAGEVEAFNIEGRIAGVKFSQRARLPYPPGSGPEGEMLGFDRFMWFVFTPAIIVVPGLLVAMNSSNDPAARILGAVSAVLLTFVLYPLQLRYLVNRRALWKAEKNAHPSGEN